jgi:hypothetical protein
LGAGFDSGLVSGLDSGFDTGFDSGLDAGFGAEADEPPRSERPPDLPPRVRERLSRPPRPDLASESRSDFASELEEFRAPLPDAPVAARPCEPLVDSLFE